MDHIKALSNEISAITIVKVLRDAAVNWLEITLVK
jgi:hypothetical protein